MQDKTLRASIHITYDLKENKASYERRFGDMLRLSPEKSAQVLSVFLNALVYTLTHNKNFSEQIAVQRLLQNAGYDKLAKKLSVADKLKDPNIIEKDKNTEIYDRARLLYLEDLYRHNNPDSFGISIPVSYMNQAEIHVRKNYEERGRG